MTIDLTDDRTARIALSLASEPGDRVTGRLVAERGAAETLRLATVSRLPKGLGGVEVREWRKRLAPRLSESDVDRAIDHGDRLRLNVLTPDHAYWPTGLADLGHAAPVVLWARGDTALFAAPVQRRVALIGARASTGYGNHVASETATDLIGDGKQIVSGAAYGIDGAAHRAALAADGATIAVLAGGLDRYYPAGHQDLIRLISGRGALLSEVPPGAEPTRLRFLQRNRLIAALSAVTVVIEAGWRSGSLNAASHASALGHPVAAFPGPTTSAASAGCHRLVREGTATLVTSADDIRELIRLNGENTLGARSEAPGTSRMGLADPSRFGRSGPSTGGVRAIQR